MKYYIHSNLKGKTLKQRENCQSVGWFDVIDGNKKHFFMAIHRNRVYFVDTDGIASIAPANTRWTPEKVRDYTKSGSFYEYKKKPSQLKGKKIVFGS